ncbi:hypothetical protein RF11_05255 [Thelohanellus kitauei]|uniref:Uncharacterized protein n=1 Tax=Thelohanellus kitauei TaxID=669202 RepID=A0A0C2N4R2_THEKT|nr:hypothetical protein RF11_05255 [Thelohanellus kitauei]
MGKQPTLFSQKIEGKYNNGSCTELGEFNKCRGRYINRSLFDIFKQFLTKFVTILEKEGEFTNVIENFRFYHSDPDFRLIHTRYNGFRDIVHFSISVRKVLSQLKSIVKRDGTI